MVAPEYQELLDKDIPKASEDGVSVVVIAGESLGKKVRYVPFVIATLECCRINTIAL